MNTISHSGSTTVRSSRRSAILKVALPAVAVAGSIVAALGTGVPTFFAAMGLNHNETLLRSDRP